MSPPCLAASATTGRATPSTRCCTDCGGRRMAEGAARLVDGVLPRVPVRQWVLSLPYRLRYLLAWDHGLARAVLAVSVRVLLGFQRRRARRYGIRDGRSGSVTVIQRFGGGLNLNVHFHTLLLDGVLFEGQEGALEFRPLPPPTDEEVGGVLARFAARVQRPLRRRGRDPWEADGVQADPLVGASPALAGSAAPRCRGDRARPARGGAGVASGGRSRRAVGALDDAAARAPGWVRSARQRRGAGNGSRAPGAALPPSDSAGGGAGRLRQVDDGRVVLTLKSPWVDGTRQLLFEPLTLLEKLAALIPRPRTNLVVYHGVLAPHSGWWARAVAYGTPPAVASPCAEASDTSKSAPRHWAWAALMRRAFDLDVLACPRCWGAAAVDRDGRGPRGNPRDPRRARRVARAGRAGAAGRGRGAAQSRGGARRLRGIQSPRSPKSVRRRLGAGSIPLDKRRAPAENPRDTLVVRAVRGGSGGGGRRWRCRERPFRQQGLYPVYARQGSRHDAARHRQGRSRHSPAGGPRSARP
jgi:hypothetical protein